MSSKPRLAGRLRTWAASSLRRAFPGRRDPLPLRASPWTLSQLEARALLTPAPADPRHTNLRPGTNQVPDAPSPTGDATTQPVLSVSTDTGSSNKDASEQASQPAATHNSTSTVLRHEVVFIDGAIHNHQELVRDL